MPRTKWLTTEDIADAFGVTTASVRRWAIEGKIRSHHRTPGGARRYKPDELDRLLREAGE